MDTSGAGSPKAAAAAAAAGSTRTEPSASPSYKDGVPAPLLQLQRGVVALVNAPFVAGTYAYQTALPPMAVAYSEQDSVVKHSFDGPVTEPPAFSSSSPAERQRIVRAETSETRVPAADPDGKPARDIIADRNKMYAGMHGRSWLCLSSGNPVRRGVFALVMNRLFDYVMLAVTLCTIVTLTIKYPGASNDRSVDIIVGHIEFGAEILFLLEVILKSTAHGFIGHKFSYLRRCHLAVGETAILLHLSLQSY